MHPAELIWFFRALILWKRIGNAISLPGIRGEGEGGRTDGPESQGRLQYDGKRRLCPERFSTFGCHPCPSDFIAPSVVCPDFNKVHRPCICLPPVLPSFAHLHQSDENKTRRVLLRAELFQSWRIEKIR